MRKFIVTALLGTAAILPQAATAATYIVTFNNGVAYVNGTTQTSPNGTTDANGVFTQTSPSYTDTFVFTLDQASTISTTFSTQRLRVPAGTGPVVSDLDFVSGSLDGDTSAFTIPTAGTDNYEQLRSPSIDLGAGTHNVVVTYNVSAADSRNGAGYSGSFNVGTTSAVPEPAAWALFIVGFGAIGAGMRRRRENLGVVSL